MKTTYIYLNYYPNGYLYVGSHTWDGPEGILDPNYHGSSGVANHYNWTPLKERLLEVVKGDRKLVAEREWIERYAKRYGIADCASLLAVSKEWISKYKTHGRVLNLHSNSAEQLGSKDIRLRSAAGHGEEFYRNQVRFMQSPDVQKRALETRKASGALKRFTDAGHTKDAKRKSFESAVKSGGFNKFIQAGLNARDKVNYEKVAEKAVRSRDYSKISEKRKKFYSEGTVVVTRWFVSVYKDDELICEGPLKHCVHKLTTKSWDVQIAKMFRRGLLEYTHHGFLFKRK